MTITLDTQISIPKAIYTQEVESGRYFVATRMWQLLRQHGALRTVYETKLAEYEVAPSTWKRT